MAQTARSCRPEALGEAASLKELLMTIEWETGKAELLTAQRSLRYRHGESPDESEKKETTAKPEVTWSY